MTFFIIILYLINLIFALFLVFVKEKDTSVTWAWLLVFLSVPILGFFIYLFFGYGLSDKQKFIVETQNVKTVDEIQKFISSKTTSFSFPSDIDYRNTDFLYSLNKVPLSHYNKVDLILDGQEKLSLLIEDLRKATDSIHLEYYAFVTDEAGLSILKVLEEKAKEGVSIKLLYDELGSKGTKKKYFKPLIDAGGIVSTFLTSQQMLLKFRMNYHNHRKIVVIDNQVSYIGGFNIADQYVKSTKQFGYWRDTHIRILGPASTLLQLRFIMDWNISVTESNKISYRDKQLYQEIPNKEYSTDIQIISSGPNNEKEQIKLTFIKLILSAKSKVWIQTPYLIPDDSIINALEIAKRSGIDVKIMLPDKPDHPFIYRATQFYESVLIKKDIEIYSYNGGFLHSKVLIIDDEISIVGSANQDIRSYKLNFETSAMIFDTTFNRDLKEAFIKDLTKSTRVTYETFKMMPYWIRIKQKISRLFSPIM
ncbi:cardiolipin synthase [Vagococcus fluvialis]|uniref:Cardiolipin synthase n=1 Tax=Vagococcus fluvialis TaxID=2738 RepID=A0A7X6I3K6_9ENTE|nr:cardiolipin synthase [Vagococcus fluvialis]NKC68571.1 cardiolipin synthase [Vagococcus fluvialis]